MELTNLSWFKVLLLTFVYWLLVVLLHWVAGSITGDSRYQIVLLVLAMIVPAVTGFWRPRSELKLWLVMSASMVLSIFALGLYLTLLEKP